MTESDTVPLKDYIETRLKYIEKVMDEREDSNKEALVLARQYSDLHFEKLNGEYTRIDKIISSTISREVYQTQHENLCQRVEILEQNRARLEGKADQSSVDRSVLIAVAGILLAIIGIILGFFGK